MSGVHRKNVETVRKAKQQAKRLRKEERRRAKKKAEAGQESGQANGAEGFQNDRTVVLKPEVR
jgi:hypothetical protein